MRGFGVAAVKSAELLPVSAQPSPFLRTALVAPGAGAGAVSEQFAPEPKPTKSTTSVVGQAPESADALLTSATLPAVADMEMVPTASGAGRPAVPPAPCASCTR